MSGHEPQTRAGADENAVAVENFPSHGRGAMKVLRCFVSTSSNASCTQQTLFSEVVLSKAPGERTYIQRVIFPKTATKEKSWFLSWVGR